MLKKAKIEKAVSKIKASIHTTVFSGAGISVESGIPPFRGEEGLWSKYEPEKFSYQAFLENPESSWKLYQNIFYDLFKKAQPNKAHNVLAKWEKRGIIKSVITQNIDGLHSKAGNETIYKIHGTYQELKCINCGNLISFKKSLLKNLPPYCKKCGGLMKPNFILFGENLPEKVYNNSIKEAKTAEVFLIVGTTGEVFPASSIPQIASQNHSFLIEINIKESNYTNSITDIFLQGKATEVIKKLNNKIEKG